MLQVAIQGTWATLKAWDNPKPVRQHKHQILTSEFGESKIQSQISIFERNPNRWENGTFPNAPPYDQRSTKWNEQQEEFARRKAYTLHKELFKKKRTLKRRPQCKHLRKSRSYSGEEYRERLVVDSGSLLHMIGLL